MQQKAERLMERKKSYTLFLALIALGVASIGTAISTGLLTTQKTIHSTGTINVVTPEPTIGLGIFSDSGCTIPLSAIQWGTMNPGATIHSTVYLKNTGNVNIKLNCVFSNWNPAAADNYLDISWDCENRVIQPGQKVTAIFTLVISPNITGITTFSVDINISATQA